MTPLAASISDATIWSVTFDDTRSVNYDRNSFIIQATDVNKKMTSFRGQASSAKMTSLGGKLTALACHLNKRVKNRS
jgi:hypothetical protein